MNKNQLIRIVNSAQNENFKSKIDSLVAEHGIVEIIDAIEDYCNKKMKEDKDKRRKDIWKSIVNDLEQAVKHIKVDRVHLLKDAYQD